MSHQLGVSMFLSRSKYPQLGCELGAFVSQSSHDLVGQRWMRHEVYIASMKIKINIPMSKLLI